MPRSASVLPSLYIQYDWPTPQIRATWRTRQLHSAVDHRQWTGPGQPSLPPSLPTRGQTVPVASSELCRPDSANRLYSAPRTFMS